MKVKSPNIAILKNLNKIMEPGLSPPPQTQKAPAKHILVESHIDLGNLKLKK